MLTTVAVAPDAVIMSNHASHVSSAALTISAVPAQGRRVPTAHPVASRPDQQHHVEPDPSDVPVIGQVAGRQGKRQHGDPPEEGHRVRGSIRC
jgi:hypothetical protein